MVIKHKGRDSVWKKGKPQTFIIKSILKKLTDEKCEASIEFELYTRVLQETSNLLTGYNVCL